MWFGVDIWHLLQTFLINILLLYFDVGLLIKFRYPKRSSSPLSMFLSDFINGAYYFESLVLIISPISLKIIMFFIKIYKILMDTVKYNSFFAYKTASFFT